MRKSDLLLHLSDARRCLLGLSAAFGLLGCATHPVVPDAASLFQDAHFAEPVERVDATRLFALSPAMQAYLANELASTVRRTDPLNGLVAALYERGGLALMYDATRTRTAAEAFEARAGNCLSLVVMTAAFAKALDLDVTYRRVQVDEQWRRIGDLYLASGHVNITLARHRIERRGEAGRQFSLTIDFLPPPALNRLHTEDLDEATIVGMYLNNRAAESLADGHIDRAYWWAREAVRQAPAEMANHNTLAVVYMRRGLAAAAEQVLRQALARSPDNTRVLANLTSLLVQQGRGDEAQAFERLLARLEPAPPFRDYELALAALEAGDAHRALALLQRELSHWPGQASVHFAVARARLALGDVARARQALVLAQAASSSQGEAALYAAKLARLTPVAP